MPAGKRQYGAWSMVGASFAGAGGLGPAPRTCQWIAGDPSHDDSCKCGAPTYVDANAVRHPYCYPHFRRSRARAAAGRTREAGFRGGVRSSIFTGQDL